MEGWGSDATATTHIAYMSQPDVYRPHVGRQLDVPERGTEELQVGRERQRDRDRGDDLRRHGTLVTTP